MKNTGYYASSDNCYCNLDGTLVQDNTSIYFGTNATVDLGTKQILLQHNPDGTLTGVSKSVSFSSYGMSEKTATGSFDLPTIPRYPTFTTNPSVTSKTETSITINRGATNVTSTFYYSLDNSNWVEMPNTTSTITGLSPNTYYVIYVKAVNSSATSYSTTNNVSATTYKVPTQSLSSRTEVSLTISWSIDTAASYVWYSINGGTTWVAVGSVNATSGSYTISGLTAGTTYSIRTKLTRSANNTQVQTTTSSWSTYKIVTQERTARTINSMEMKWTSSENVNYVWYSIDNGSTWTAVGSTSGTTGTYTIGSLTPNTTYQIKTRIRRSADTTLSISAKTDYTTYDIARITNLPDNLVIGNNATVEFTNPGLSSVALAIYNADASQALAPYRTVVQRPYTFNFTQEEITNLYNYLSNGTSGNIRYHLRTYANGSYYYDIVTKKVSVNESTNKPTFTNFTYADTNSNVTTLTGNNQILVKGFSNVTVTISTANKAAAKNGTTMSRYRITIGSKSTEVAYSSNADVTATINAVDSATILVEAIDNRGLSTIVSKTATFKEYSKPTITTAKIERENGIGTKALFNLEGKYWNDTFGSTTNGIQSVYFRYKEKSSSTYSSLIRISDFVTYSNGSYTTISGSFLPTTANGTTPINFAVGTEYNIEFTVADMAERLTYTTTTLTLNNGIPCVDKYKDSNGTYHLGINQLANPNYALDVTGTVRLNGREFDYVNANTGNIFETGRKINNKIEYCKRVDFGTLPNTTAKNVAHNLTGVTFTRAPQGLASSGTTYLPLPYYPYGGDLTTGMSLDIVGNNIRIYTGNDRSYLTAVIEVYFIYNS